MEFVYELIFAVISTVAVGLLMGAFIAVVAGIKCKKSEVIKLGWKWFLSGVLVGVIGVLANKFWF